VSGSVTELESGDWAEPSFEGFCLGRGNGLDDTKDGFGINTIGKTQLAVGGAEFQLSDFFGHFKIALFYEFFLKVVPVFARSFIAGQGFDNVNYREPPFVVVDGLAYFFAPEDGDFCGFHKSILFVSVVEAAKTTVVIITGLAVGSNCFS
jgi:hypothetical protein